jgi:hypothetical protein
MQHQPQGKNETELYWDTVNNLAATFPKPVIMVSQEVRFKSEHVAGRIVEAMPNVAAENIVNGLYRLANDAEIKKHHDETAEAQEKAKALAVENKGVHIHPVIASAPEKPAPTTEKPKGK